MSYLDEFRSNPPVFETDNTDKTSLKVFRRPFDKTSGLETGLPLPDKTDKTPERETDDLALDSWEWIEERAAILEFDGGLAHEEAELQAFTAWFHRFVEAAKVQP